MTGKDRLVLENVPRVGFYGDMVAAGSDHCPEDMPFPSCLAAALRYLGEATLGCRHLLGEGCQETECAYGHLMSVCGQGFMLNWNRREWDFGNGNVLNLTEDGLAPVRWAMEATGYAFQALGNPAVDSGGLFPVHGDEAAFRHAILAGIEAGRPVLGFGVVGPPECCIITGYDEGGDVLIGWSFFQGSPEFSAGLEYEPSGYFRKRDWYRDTLGIVVLTGKVAAPDPVAVRRATLERARAIMATPRVRDRWAAGVAAYEAWAASLEDEGQFAEADEAGLRRMHQVHNDAVGNVAEYRSYCANFLHETAVALPAAADELEQAGGCFAVEHDLMWRAWECLGGHQDYTQLDEEPALAFRQPEGRGCIAAVVRAAAARDAEALAHIVESLALLDDGGTLAGIPTGATPAGEGGAAPKVTQPPPRRVLLEGVPYVGFDAARTGGQPEGTWMCSAMRGALAYLGEPASYQFLMGVSGAAFRLSWNPERWDGGNISTLRIGDDPMTPYRRAFGAVGWVPLFFGNRGWHGADPTKPAANIYVGPDYLGSAVEYGDEPLFRDMLVHNLHHKRYPLLAIGAILPPECGVVCGYDEGGDVLIGWNAFQAFAEMQAGGEMSFEPTGQYRKRDWFANTVGLITFHYKTARPNRRDAYADALAWALTVGRAPAFRGYTSGLAAYEAWAEGLGRDAEFAAADGEGLSLRLMCHNDAIACIGEGREHAAGFLRAAAEALPAVCGPLLAAARHYDAERQAISRIVAVLGGFGWEEERARRLGDRASRRAIVPLIREARELDARALDEIERAARSLGKAAVSE